MLINSYWKPGGDKMEAKFHTLQGNFISYGGRLILLSGCLTNVPLYMLLFYEIPKGPLNRMNYFMRRLIWQEKEGSRKYYLVNWEVVCQPLEMGGLGVLDLAIFNKCLLSKWLWKLENFERGLAKSTWKKILDERCLVSCGN
jgi:hypothetical protein